jgi:hypothetical protein
MNKDNAHEYLPLVQALANGKTIQVLGKDGNWYDSKLINTPPSRYRIKPDEPRTFDLMIRELDGSICRWNPAHANNQWKRITVQEVI